MGKIMRLVLHKLTTKDIIEYQGKCEKNDDSFEDAPFLEERVLRKGSKKIYEFPTTEKADGKKNEFRCHICSSVFKKRIGFTYHMNDVHNRVRHD